MTKKLLLLAVSLLTVAGLHAADVIELRSVPKGSKVRIEGTSTIHDWQVESTIIGGTAQVGPGLPLEPGAEVKPGPIEAKVDAFIPVNQLKSVKKDGATPVADTRTWQAAASYDVGAAKLFGQFGKVDNQTSGNEYDIAGLGASVPVGSGKLLAQWGRIKPETGAKRTTISAGYDHFLSKRTDLYAVAMSDKLDGQSSGSAFAVGIRHRF